MTSDRGQREKGIFSLSWETLCTVLARVKGTICPEAYKNKTISNKWWHITFSQTRDHDEILKTFMSQICVSAVPKIGLGFYTQNELLGAR